MQNGGCDSLQAGRERRAYGVGTRLAVSMLTGGLTVPLAIGRTASVVQAAGPL